MRNKKDFIYLFVAWSLALGGFYKLVKYAVIHAPYLFTSALCLLVLWVWWMVGRCRLPRTDDQKNKAEEQHWRSNWDKPEPSIPISIMHNCGHPQPIPITLRQRDVWSQELDRDFGLAQKKSAARAKKHPLPGGQGCM